MGLSECKSVRQRNLESQKKKNRYKMGLSRASLWKETKVLFHPYYWINIILCGSFVFMRLMSPFCQILFGPGKEACELDMRENEILFFLLVIVMVKSRKSGATSTAAAYLASGFIYAKIANLILFFRVDPRMGLVYLVAFLIQAMLLPEPTYKGPENLVYFRATGLDDELKRDPRVTWLVAFYAAWSPACINFAPIFSKLSADYGLANLKFGKLDVGRYPEIGEKHHISTSALSRQLPTLIMFQDGKEVGRIPAIISGQVQKCNFKEEDLVNTFDLNNLYVELQKDKRFKQETKKEQ